MTKNNVILQTRQDAFSVILCAARAATRHVPMTGAQRRELEEALETLDAR